MTTDGRFDADALVVGMSLVPDLFSRNRMYALFEDPVVRHARSRARLLRSVLADLSGRHGPVSEVSREDGRSSDARLRYRVKSLGVERRVELTPVELAVLSLLCDKAGIASLVVTEEQRRVVGEVLSRLPRKR